MATALAVVFVCGSFDAAFTHSQVARGNFLEANRLAAAVSPSDASLVAWKLPLFGAGLATLYRFRRRASAEAGAWALAVLHLALMGWWIEYIRTVACCLNDPAVSAPVVQF